MASCATPKERAERLVKKANKLYPINSLVDHTIRIDTVLKYDTTIIVDSTLVKLSLPIYKTDTIYVNGKQTIVYKPIPYNNKVVIDNERSKLIVNSKDNGDLVFTLTLKEQKIRVQGTIRFKHTIKTYRTLITITVKKKDYFWWSGLLLNILVGGTLIFLSIRTVKKLINPIA